MNAPTKNARDALRALLECEHPELHRRHLGDGQSCAACGAFGLDEGASTVWIPASLVASLGCALEEISDDGASIPLALVNLAPAAIGADADDLAVLVAASMTSLGWTPIVRWKKHRDGLETFTTQEVKKLEGEKFTRTYQEITRRTMYGDRRWGWKK